MYCTIRVAALVLFAGAVSVVTAATPRPAPFMTVHMRQTTVRARPAALGKVVGKIK